MGTYALRTIIAAVLALGLTFTLAAEVTSETPAMDLAGTCCFLT